MLQAYQELRRKLSGRLYNLPMTVEPSGGLGTCLSTDRIKFLSTSEFGHKRKLGKVISSRGSNLQSIKLYFFCLA